jgi:hypothetical protein
MPSARLAAAPAKYFHANRRLSHHGASAPVNRTDTPPPDGRGGTRCRGGQPSISGTNRRPHFKHLRCTGARHNCSVGQCRLRSAAAAIRAPCSAFSAALRARCRRQVQPALHAVITRPAATRPQPQPRFVDGDALRPVASYAAAHRPRADVVRDNPSRTHGSYEQGCGRRAA